MRIIIFIGLEGGKNPALSGGWINHKQHNNITEIINVVVCFILLKGGDILCKEFVRDPNCEWVHEMVTRCMVCLYRGECGKSDERTAICHGYHHINKRGRILK